MKRTYSRDLHASTALSTPIELGDLDETERRIARVAELLRDANRNRIDKYLQDADRHQAILVAAAREAAQKQAPPHSAHMTMSIAKDDGTHEFKTIVLIEPSPEVVDLMDNPQSLFTGLMWTGLDMPDRIAMLQQLGLGPDLVLAEGPLEIFPEKSKRHLLRWQKQINTGAIWNNARTVGQRAMHLIEEGYLLFGKQAFADDTGEMPGRDDLAVGRPGTPAFVRAIMGQPYLDWLIAHEEHPVEVA